MSFVPIDARADTPTIPPELFRPIVRAFDGHRPMLAALAPSHSFLQEEVMPLLYNSLTESSASDTNLHVAFLSSISRNPHLASFVRVYWNIGILHHQNSPLWTTFLLALGNMTNLKVLYFETYGRTPAAMLLVNAPFQLERLYLGNHSEGDPISLILQQQRSLKYLYLEARGGVVFSPTCCPALEELAGNRATVEALLPGRHIVKVALVPALLDFVDASVNWNVWAIAPALRNLKALSFGAFFSRPNLNVVADHLGQLERLEVVGLLANETDLFRRFQSLRELVISFNWGGNSLPISDDIKYRQNLVNEIFANCPNLQYIEIAYQRTIVMTQIWYQRWNRESAQAVPQLILTTYVKLRRFGWVSGA